MSTESARHYVLSPLTACKARLFLIQRSLQKAVAPAIQSDLQTELLTQVDFLNEKIEELQKRIEEKLSAT